MQNLNKFILPDNFRGKSLFSVQLWWVFQSLFFSLSPQFMYGWRRFLLRLFGAKIGKNVLIRPSVKVVYPWKLKIDNNSWIGDDVVLYTLGEIEIGSNVVISQRSYICAAGHDYKSDNFNIFAKKIIINDKAWLATDVFVAPGVIIGSGAVIGARSSVFKNIPSMMVCYGSPAIPIKQRKYE